MAAKYYARFFLEVNKGYANSIKWWGFLEFQSKNYMRKLKIDPSQIREKLDEDYKGFNIRVEEDPILESMEMFDVLSLPYLGKVTIE